MCCVSEVFIRAEIIIMLKKFVLMAVACACVEALILLRVLKVPLDVNRINPNLW